MKLIHLHGKSVELKHDDRLLFRYVYGADGPAMESPRPYVHPVMTLDREVVTIFRPHDHLWHHGLSMTSANLSGENFWGGPTYVEGRGYAMLDNIGRTVHEEWERVEPEGLLERLAWITQGGERWLDERREIGVVKVDTESGHWVLTLNFHFRNVSGRELELGSPTTAGRPLAGYGGLFWRGPRSFTGGQILGPDGLEGEAAMGRRAPWLAFSGRHDGSGAASTLVFEDDPGNLRHPTQWFVRSQPYACMSASFMFDEAYSLPPGAELSLRYRIVVASGAWSRERIEGCLAGLP
jgi:hypothetical protein